MSVKALEAVQTAALLGKSGRHELALELLDVVVEHSEDEDIRAAAYACALKIHCDRGEPATALAVGRPVWERRPGVELGYALIRAYWERFEQTESPDDRDAWLDFKDELDSLL